MQKIKEISDLIDGELDGAARYIRYALKYENHDKDLADMYYALSHDEMQHQMKLHQQGVRVIDEYKSEGNTVPVAMQAVYDHLHERHIEKANDVKMLQSQYRS